MKKRNRLIWVLALLGLLCGCAPHSGNNVTVLFYYAEAQPEFRSEEGALEAEKRTFEGELPAYDEFLNLYFQGPEDDALKSPFPSGLQCLGTSLDDTVLTVILSEEFSALTGIQRSIAAACITKTLCQFASVTGVCLELQEDAKSTSETRVLTTKDFVCQDLGAVNTETAVRLYFSDSNGRYLVSSDRENYFSDASQIPAYVVQQLINGPTDEGQLNTMPEGTSLLGITVDEDGVCVVDLSSEFLFNKPTTGLMERMTVLSLVNSLTELEPVKSVRILVEGEIVGQYLNLDLDRNFVRDESALDMVREGLNETDATLYVRGCSDTRLAPVPVSLRQTSQVPIVEMLIEELAAFEDINGLENPLPDGTTVQWVQMRGGICYVDFSRHFLEFAGDAAREQMAVQAVTATLMSLDQVNGVKISVNGDDKGFQHCTLTRVHTVDEEWLS